MDCSIETEKTGDNAIVTVAGYIDAHTFEELEDEVQGLLDDECFRIAMELSKVNYISSAGIGVLVNIQANCQGSGGNLVLINPADCLREVFQMFGIWELFTVVPTKADALKVLASGEVPAAPAQPAAPPPPPAGAVPIRPTVPLPPKPPAPPGPPTPSSPLRRPRFE
ncbi:MAG TPA: STAS domain-containing protein [Planctomycetota bacterium]|nr:STAS domain-containing protein [Planctomycetota bacterium]